MKWNFPAIKTTRTLSEQYDKILDECEEYFEETLKKPTKENLEKQDKESIDILHSVETFIRIRFKGREEELEKLIQETILKNTKRGYYESNCY